VEDLSIREILEQVARGQIRIPAFQRGFVWDPERIAYLMDSIYKNYPFGSLLFWRTKEKLKFDRDLGPFTLPTPKEDYPVDYVLDGQQRVTSIFGVFQTELTMSVEAENWWLPIFFDLSAEPTAQESQFVALKPNEVISGRHFPLNTLFDTISYRKATVGFDDITIKRIDDIQAVFKENKIPVQISKTEDKATVAIIFERINRQGVELTTLQLLSAWTWSEEFQLQDQFSELAEELSPFGFAEIGGDTNLLLRCCSAVLTGDASPQALMALNGSAVRAKFDTITNGVKYAVDYIRANFLAETLANLPFTTLLVPLAVFFAVDGNKERSVTDLERKKINQWFWRSAFSKRYSSGVLRNLNIDIEQMAKLRDGKDNALGDFPASVGNEFFIENTFGIGNVNTKTFILMLASEFPRSFISGAPVDLKATLKDANRTEFHHLMPQSFLRKESQNGKIGESVLANFAFMSRADNRKLGGDAPSIYRAKMSANVGEILSAAISPEILFDDRYEEFIQARATALTVKARHICGLD
jgi:hypothetical protein